MRPITTIAIAGLTASISGQALASSTDEVRALVSEMMADAESRSSLLQSGGTAGHDGHFFLASPDGNFRLNVAGQLQFRYILNFRDDGDGSTIDDFEPGFQTRRTKLSFSGDVYGDYFYKVKGSFSRASGTFGLEDAYAGVKLDNGVKVKWGQFKTKFLREENVSSTSQLAADRSAVNEAFNQDRSQGVELSYEDESWRGYFAFTDGFGSRNTDLGADPADFALTARADFLLGGSWGQFKDFTSKRGSEQGIMIGAGLHWEQGPDTPAAADEQTIFSFTADASYEDDGWNLYGAFVYQDVSDAGGVSGADFEDYGFVFQGGVYVADDVELFGRYDIIISEDAPSGTPDDDFSTVTFGVNYYLHGHAAKFTLDINYYLDSTDGNFNVAGGNSGIGLLDSGAEEDQFVVRAQFQLLF